MGEILKVSVLILSVGVHVNVLIVEQMRCVFLTAEKEE